MDVVLIIVRRGPPGAVASRTRSEHSDEQSAEQLQEVNHPDDESSPSRQLRQPGCDFR